jgi:hypothetical protein
MHTSVSPADIETMRMSRIIGDTNQAIGRRAVRQMTDDGDVPPGCTVDLIASSVGPMGFTDPRGTLAEMFPGATIKQWFPKVPHAKPNMEMLLTEAARKLLGNKGEVLVTSAQWANEAGHTARHLQRTIRKGVLFAVLEDHGMTVEKQGQKWLLKRKHNAERQAAA